MTQEEIKQYLKDNLKLSWGYYGEHYHIILTLEGERITDLDFGEGY